MPGGESAKWQYFARPDRKVRREGQLDSAPACVVESEPPGEPRELGGSLAFRFERLRLA
jgi:hypothetical protein